MVFNFLTKNLIMKNLIKIPAFSSLRESFRSSRLSDLESRLESSLLGITFGGIGDGDRFLDFSFFFSFDFSFDFFLSLLFFRSFSRSQISLVKSYEKSPRNTQTPKLPFSKVYIVSRLLSIFLTIKKIFKKSVTLKINKILDGIT